jgi:hemoglobin/transferrin/lactoferrin receptor protein
LIKAKRAFLSGSVALVVFANINGAVAQTATGSQTPQQASPVARDFNIPAQPLQSALLTFNRQSGMQITSAANATQQGVRVNTLSGRFTPQQALEKLLAGTGVSFYFTGNGAAVIGERQTVGGAQTLDGSTVLETIVVTGKTDRNAATGSGFQGTPDWVYEAPASVSVVSQEAIQNNPATRSAADTLDSVAGVLTNRADGQKPGIQVNVRGLQDMGRVTTMIDGARQNFQRSGHGGYQQTFVDTAFIRAIEVEKNTSKGVGGAGSLGGSVNFRTVEAGDIIQEGRLTGAQIEARSGTNAYNFVGSAIGAARLSDTFSILGGVSVKNIGDYKIGSKGSTDPSDLTVDNDSVLFSQTHVVNTLLKAEWDVTEDLNFQGSWLHYDGKGSTGGFNGNPSDEDLRNNTQSYGNDTLTVALAYDPESELIDAKARLWYNDTANGEKRDYNESTTQDYSYGMKSFGGSIENTSRFSVPAGELALHYGVEAYQDNGNTRSLTPQADGLGYDGTWGLRGSNPPGKRWMASAFTSATLQHDEWLTLTGGLRYDYYRLRGSTVVQDRRFVTTPANNCQRWQDIDGDGTEDPNGLWANADGSIILDGTVANPGVGYDFYTPQCDQWETPASSEWVNDAVPVDVDKSGGAWLPSATIAVKPFEWLQPFISYSRSYRPPAVFEALLSGGHPNQPFENAPNPYLEPERGETWEFGANISRNSLFTEDDAFRMKAVYFRRNIKDYITFGQNYYEPIGRDSPYLTSVNLDGTTKMRGIEIEGNYDLGRAYIGGSYTRLDTDWADTYTPIQHPVNGGIDATPDPTILYLPPKVKLTVDAGMRFFEKRLVLGARLNHVSETETGFGQLSGYINPTYTTYDLYGSFDITPQAKLRFGVTNVTDELYVPSLGTTSYPAAGRTYTASLKMTF